MKEIISSYEHNLLERLEYIHNTLIVMSVSMPKNIIRDVSRFMAEQMQEVLKIFKEFLEELKVE